MLRHGAVSGECTPKEETVETMAQLMIGRACRSTSTLRTKPAIFDCKSTTYPCRPTIRSVSIYPVNLSVRAGEIPRDCQAFRNGQAELLAALSGEKRARADMVQIMGQSAGHMDAAQRRNLGLGLCFVPEERLGKGAVPAMSLAENAPLTAYQSPKFGMLRRGLIQRKTRELADRCIQEFQVKCQGNQSTASSLSGGNLQNSSWGAKFCSRPNS